MYNILLILLDPTLSYESVKELLNGHGLTKERYAGINAELGVPLLLRKCSDTFGIKLWILRDSSVTWSDLAIALYNLYFESTDAALDELLQKYLPNTGDNILYITSCHLCECFIV